MDTTNKLDTIEKKNNFTVPADYFENFAYELQKKLPQKKESFFTFFNKIRTTPRVAYALCFMLLISFSLILFNRDHTDEATLSSLSDTEAQLAAIDEDILAALIDESAIESEEIASSEEIENYLIINNVDFFTIINELKTE